MVCYSNRVPNQISQRKEHLGQKPGKASLGSWVSFPSGVTRMCISFVFRDALLSLGVQRFHWGSVTWTQSPNLTDSTSGAKHFSIKHLIPLVLCGLRPQAHENQAEYSRGSELISQKLAKGQSRRQAFLGNAQGLSSLSSLR